MRTIDRFGSVIVTGADGIDRYVAPFGNPVGLAERMAIWGEGLARDRGLPWVGLGLHADIVAAGAALATLDSIRAALVEKGMLDPNDRTTDLGQLIGVLL